MSFIFFFLFGCVIILNIGGFMSKKKIIILVLAILVIIIAILFRIFSMASVGEYKVEDVLALTDKQADIEKTFESEGLYFRKT